MTRRPKTPKSIWHSCKWWMFRRQPKGRRAKSGQWWRRHPRPVLWGSAVGLRIEAMRVRREAVGALKAIARERGYGPVKFTTNDRSDKP